MHVSTTTNIWSQKVWGMSARLTGQQITSSTLVESVTSSTIRTVLELQFADNYKTCLRGTGTHGTPCLFDVLIAIAIELGARQSRAQSSPGKELGVLYDKVMHRVLVRSLQGSYTRILFSS